MKKETGIMCEVCEKFEGERHHENYNEPDNVIYLCPSCHRLRHENNMSFLSSEKTVSVFKSHGVVNMMLNKYYSGDANQRGYRSVSIYMPAVLGNILDKYVPKRGLSNLIQTLLHDWVEKRMNNME